MRSISILGSTGSVGDSTLKLLRQHRSEWRVEALTAHCSATKLAELAREFDAKIAVVSDESCLPELREALSGMMEFGAYRQLMGLLEHLRCVNCVNRAVTHGLYEPHGAEGRSSELTRPRWVVFACVENQIYSAFA